ncbi:MAG: hypothetical protein JWP95_1412 [Actinotalea sp.]|nr:hypothetical protein [Actinotalea sp.]
MKYMLLMAYGGVEDGVPMDRWAPEDVHRDIQFMGDLGAGLAARGELVVGQGLSGPDAAKVVTNKGAGATVVTDGPFPESKEFLAGYWLVDVESAERALEIAALTSAAPGPEGAPLGQQIEVRAVMSAPDPEL